MFQFSGFAHLSVYYLFKIVGCPIQVSADQSVCASPRSFSQLITPFIASESQGIPHTPLVCLFILFLVEGLKVIMSNVLKLSTFDFGLSPKVFFLLSYFLISICQ